MNLRMLIDENEFDKLKEKDLNEDIDETLINIYTYENTDNIVKYIEEIQHPNVDVIARRETLVKIMCMPYKNDPFSFLAYKKHGSVHLCNE